VLAGQATAVDFRDPVHSDRGGQPGHTLDLAYQPENFLAGLAVPQARVQ
jgi:hypothetical protein